MKIYKAKSLVPNKTNHEIEKGCHGIRFVSFETAIQRVCQELGLMSTEDKPVGYRVTEQGIEICFD